MPTPTNEAFWLNETYDPTNPLVGLQTIDGGIDGEVVFTSGYYAPGDGGGGEFYWALGNTDTVDNGITFAGNTSAGRWKRVYSGPINVRWFGAKGDTVTDDTVNLQNALDYAVGSLYFPDGTYKITGTGDACLTMTKNVNLLADKSRTTRIVGVGCGSNTSLIKVAITDNGGAGDVRELQIRNLEFLNSGGGKHAIEIAGTMANIQFLMFGCNVHAGTHVDGRAVYCTNMSFGGFENNTFSPGISLVGPGSADGLRVEKNTFLGAAMALILDIEEGSYSHSIEKNVFTNRDGAIHVINGSQVKIRNNQIEHALSNGGVNSGLHECHIWIEGRSYTSEAITIEDNNFGGGSNLKVLMYIDKAKKTFISRNYLIAPGLQSDPAAFDVVFTENSSYNYFEQSNIIVGTQANPRPAKPFPAVIQDSGVGNFGVVQPSSTLNLQNTWTGGDYVKLSDGFVTFLSALNGGNTAPGLIGTFPTGFLPADFSTVIISTSGGPASLALTPAGTFSAASPLPANADVAWYTRFLCENLG